MSRAIAIPRSRSGVLWFQRNTSATEMEYDVITLVPGPLSLTDNGHPSQWAGAIAARLLHLRVTTRIGDRMQRGGAYMVLVLAAMACSVEPPDGVYRCSDDLDCPRPLRCYEALCRRRPVAGEQSDPRDMTLDAQVETSASQDAAVRAERDVMHTELDAGARMPSGDMMRAASPMQPSTSSMSPSAAGSPAPAMSRCPAGACEGGRCVEGPDDYSCNCGAGFSGTGTKSCTQIDDCTKPDPCAPGGECVDGTNAYTCRCSPGYTGTGSTRCIDIDDCASAPCGPGGTCTDGVNTHSCQCADGFSGTGTEACVNIDDCGADRCAPGGVCKDGVNDYSCTCELRSPDPKTCPYKRTADGTFDSTTNLTWCEGASFAYSANGEAQNIMIAKEACTSSGCRVPTLAELKASPLLVIFDDPPNCFVASTARYCEPGANSSMELYTILCVK